MKTQLIFVGNKFIHNKALKEYILQKIDIKFDFINSIIFFKESDNSLFLYLQNELNTHTKMVIITTKQNFSTIGKVVCTITDDNLVLKDEMLMPTKATVYEERSYLLEFQDAQINILHTEEMQKMPEILLSEDSNKATIHLFEYAKDAAQATLKPLAQRYDVEIETIALIDGWLQLEIVGKKYGNISKFINASKELLPNNIIAASNIVKHIIEELAKSKRKITFAESCSGGLLSYYFTKQNGASKVLDGALVTYSNSIKENWLAVSEKTLLEHGAVSAEVVLEMSEGALNVSNADYAIAISGIAGDSGATKDKPIGTVHIGISSKTHQAHLHLKLDGERNYIQEQSVLFAIKMLILIDKEIFF